MVSDYIFHKMSMFVHNCQGVYFSTMFQNDKYFRNRYFVILMDFNCFHIFLKNIFFQINPKINSNFPYLFFNQKKSNDITIQHPNEPQK